MDGGSLLLQNIMTDNTRGQMSQQQIKDMLSGKGVGPDGKPVDMSTPEGMTWIQYQLNQYTMYWNLKSNSVKTYTEMLKSIVQNVK